MRDISARRDILERFVEDRTDLLRAYKNKIAEHTGTPRAQLLVYRAFTTSLEVAIASYSLGCTITELSNGLDLALAEFDQLDPDTTEDGTGESINLDGYYRYLAMISLLILLDDDDERLMRFYGKLEKLNVQDRLISQLARFRTKAVQLPEELFLGTQYEKLLKSLTEKDKSLAENTLASYLADWNSLHKQNVWYGSHKETRTLGYFGYWSFEAAAVAKLRGICNPDVINHKLFPKDLVIAEGASPHGDKRVSYPNFNSLAFTAPNDWKDQSEERLGLISPNGKLEVAGTVYRVEDPDFQAFASARQDSIERAMAWYKPVREGTLVSIASGFPAVLVDYRGMWPGEQLETFYRTYSIKLDDQHMLSLTFTMFTMHLEIMKNQISRFVNSIKYSGWP